MDSFNLSDVITDGDVCIVRVGGYVDFDVAPELKHCIVGHIAAGARNLVVDLSDTEFIDSTAIGVLIGALKRMRDLGGSMAVVCDTDSVRNIFEIVGLENVIPLHRSRDAAVAALGQAV